MEWPISEKREQIEEKKNHWYRQVNNQLYPSWPIAIIQYKWLQLSLVRLLKSLPNKIFNYFEERPVINWSGKIDDIEKLTEQGWK